MKIRAGFVSNSSSASFTIKWRKKYTEEKDSPTKALCQLFDMSYFLYDEEKDELKTSYGCKTELDRLQQLILHTKLQDGVFETHDWTCMMNSYFDFSEQMGYLLLALHSDCDFEVISAEVHAD